MTLEELHVQWRDCTRCALCEKRKQIVPGHGNPNASIMFISDKPGRDEDRKGIPMVGQVVKYFDETLRTVGLRREEVYVTNSVMCLPPGNRMPFTPELDACKERLIGEILLVDPDVLILMGRATIDNLLGLNKDVTKLQRRKFLLDIPVGDTTLQYPCITTYNPALSHKKDSIERFSPRYFLYKVFRTAKMMADILEEDYGRSESRTANRGGSTGLHAASTTIQPALGGEP